MARSAPMYNSWVEFLRRSFVTKLLARGQPPVHSALGWLSSLFQRVEHIENEKHNERDQRQNKHAELKHESQSIFRTHHPPHPLWAEERLHPSFVLYGIHYTSSAIVV